MSSLAAISGSRGNVPSVPGFPSPVFRLGNRLSQGGTGNGVTIGQPNFSIDTGTNRIVGYCYDNSGNLTDEGGCPVAGSPHRYTYDGANRLAAVNNGTATASYTYFGPLRIKKVAGGTTTVYIYSGNKPIVEYVGGQISKEYIYSGSQLLATVAGGAFTYHHPDHLSNRAETDDTGTVTRRFGHFPFGEAWYETGTADKWKFTSYERDTMTGETGLDYAVFRYYSSGQARFLSPDLRNGVIGSPESLNHYSYVDNDPINFVDHLGLFKHVVQCADGATPVYDSGGHLIGCVSGGGGGGAGGGGGGAGGGGGGGGAGPAPKDDCHKFADMVEQIANSSSNVQEFMDKMASTFTAATNSGATAMFRGAYNKPPPSTRGFTDSGFQPQFQDGSNQVRHFTGGLVAGYDLGALGGLALMDSRETVPGGNADIALNAFSTDAGAQLKVGPSGEAIPSETGGTQVTGMDYHDLANFIREKICKH